MMKTGRFDVYKLVKVMSYIGCVVGRFGQLSAYPVFLLGGGHWGEKCFLTFGGAC